MRVFITKQNGRELLNIEDAQIIHKNFSGRETQYNREGNRNFSVILDEESALELKDRGWAPRSRPSRDNPDEVFYFLPVTVNFNCNYPPKVWRISGGKKTLMEEPTVGVIDMSEIVAANIVINPRFWQNNGREGIKAYLHTAYIEVEEDAFASRYEDYQMV